jgi:AraC-like DNA-binding protein
LKLQESCPILQNVDVLSDVLRVVRLSGAVFFRAAFSAPWALASPDARLLSALLAPGRHLVLFHAIQRGSCWVELAGTPRARLGAGDVVVFPCGDAHAMGNGAPEDTGDVTQLFPGPPPWSAPPLLAYGGPGEATELVCGFLQLDHGLFNPLLASLPRCFVVQTASASSGPLLQASLQFLGHELAQSSPGIDSVLGRLTELVFVEVLRQHMAGLPVDALGFLPALRDPAIGKSLALMHAAPATPWDVEELSRRVGMSRSAFAARFHGLVGDAPAQYLTRWRLALAAQRLRDSDDGLASIAEAVGYASEAALSKAFKRELGTPPAQYRRESRLALGRAATAGA